MCTHDLSDKHLLVGVERARHNVQQSSGLGLELKLFLGASNLFGRRCLFGWCLINPDEVEVYEVLKRNMRSAAKLKKWNKVFRVETLIEYYQHGSGSTVV
jgi:hypothetical protein